MIVSFGSQYTQRPVRWSALTVEQIKRRGIYQAALDESEGVWTVWFYDASELFYAQMWTGALPQEQINTGYTQEQNDADLSDFLSFWQSDANHPLDAREADGRSITTSYPAYVGTQTQFVGSGDFPSQDLLFEFAGPDTLEVVAQFATVCQLADGAAIHTGSWDARDRISFGVRIDANTVTPNGSNTGNCNLFPIGVGQNAIVPANGDGTHDIDLATAKPVIVDINGTTDCPWWTDPKTGVITPAVRQQGNSLLLDFQKEFWLVNSCPIGAPDGHWDIDVWRAEFIHPSWKLIAKVVKVSAGAGILSGQLLIYRIGNLGV